MGLKIDKEIERCRLKKKELTLGIPYIIWNIRDLSI